MPEISIPLNALGWIQTRDPRVRSLLRLTPERHTSLILMNIIIAYVCSFDINIIYRLYREYACNKPFAFSQQIDSNESL